MALALKVHHAVNHVLEHFRTRERPLLRHMAHQEDRNAPFLCAAHERLRALPDLPDTARRAVHVSAENGLNGVDNHEFRRDFIDCLNNILHLCLRVHVKLRFVDAQAVCAKLELARRLLAGHIQDRVRPAHGAADLKQQRRLPHSGFSADEDEKTPARRRRLTRGPAPPCRSRAVLRRQWQSP